MCFGGFSRYQKDPGITDGKTDHRVLEKPGLTTTDNGRKSRQNETAWIAIAPQSMDPIPPRERSTRLTRCAEGC